MDLVKFNPLLGNRNEIHRSGLLTLELLESIFKEIHEANKKTFFKKYFLKDSFAQSF
jgi:hypothetical protein